MEDLLGDDPGLGLNIVCTNPSPTPNLDDGLKKKKKYNKYEKRRYKAKIAKLTKEGIIPQQPPKLQPKVPEPTNDTNIEANLKKFDSEHLKSSKKKIFDNSEKDHMEGKIENDEDKDMKDQTEEEIEGSDNQMSKSDNDSTSSSSIDDKDKKNASIDPDRKASRRYHIKNDLEEEDKRAAYMAEFHAHPMEMDRRSKAESKIKTSTSSSHIFMSNSKSFNSPSTQDQTNNESNDSADNDDDIHQCPFQSLGLNKRLSTTISSERGPFAIQRPTVVQARSLSKLLPSITKKKEEKSKQNVFIQSETGSGKTLAYLLPVIQSLLPPDTQNTTILSKSKDTVREQRSNQTPRALVILPTRELALQTYQTTMQLTLHSKINVTPVCLSGGEKRKSEKARLRKGFSILIGTPGRLLDHMQKTECLRTSLSLSNHMDSGKRHFNTLEWLVLDEADRLLDMGLGGQVKQILEIIRHLCGKSWDARGYGMRSVLVSATVTDEMQKLAKDLLDSKENSKKSSTNLNKGKNAWIWISATNKEVQSDVLSQSIQNDDEIQNFLPLADAAPRQLAQQHLIVSAKLRLPALVAFLMARVKEKQRVVVFMATCDGVDYHHGLFTAMDSFFLGGRDNKDDEGPKGIFGNECNLYRLHGNIPHSERNGTVQKFTNAKFGFASAKDINNGGKQSKSNILFATDVAARGLNLPGVDWIVQYDPPCETADYIHRAGRTARAGKAGNALLFLLPSERQYMEILDIKGLKGVNTALSLTSTLKEAAELCPHLTKEGERKSGGGSRIGEAFALAAQIKLEECVVQDTITRKQSMKKLKNDKKAKGKRREGKQVMASIKEQEENSLEKGLQALARNAFTSFLRAYPTKEKSVRHIFSTRALHLGHIARSFALKDPPKALRTPPRKKGHMDSKKNEKNENETYSKTTKKRNANLAFEENTHIIFDNGKERKATTRSKTKKLKGKFSGRDNGPLKRESAESIKSKMMSAAKKIQSGGMDFF